MYITPTTIFERFDASRTQLDMFTYPPHERIHDEFESQPTMISDLNGAEHESWCTPEYKARAGDSPLPLFPCELYLDGVSFAKHDSVLGITLGNCLTKVKHLAVAFRKSNFCKCGCKGWCSLFCVFDFLRWSLAALLQGVFPCSRHDLLPWGVLDAFRSELAGSAMRIRGFVVRLKGDWAEFAHSLGFPSWASQLFPCLFCHASKEELYRFRGCNPFDFPYRLFTCNLYLSACAACETVVHLNSEQVRARLLSCLAYDKRTTTNSSNGRALTHAIPELNLDKGDRLEPSRSLRDVGLLATVPLPLHIIFWKLSAQTKTKHRNPLFLDDTGITMATLAIDILHTLHLGVSQC
jgi:hypothetical protein